MLPTLLRNLARLTAAIIATAIVIAAIFARADRPSVPAAKVAPPGPEAAFSLPGPQGNAVVAQLPELARIPPLEIEAACARLRTHNAKARALQQGSPGDDGDDEDPKRTVHDAAEADCANPAGRDYHFYNALGDVLNAGSVATRDDADRLIATMREALRTAQSAEHVATTLMGIDTRATYLADRLHAPEFFLIGAEAMAARLRYCTGDGAAECRAKANTSRGTDLVNGGRWLGETRHLRDGIAAYRDALRDTAARSSDWADLHTLVGSALANLSEHTDEDVERKKLLREALAEYDTAASAVPATDDYTWALINQNVCSIREPLARIEKDRASTLRAIGECEKALTYYEKRKEKPEQAAAHYNMARAYEWLADQDQDADEAMQAVVHVRQTVQLYDEEGVKLSLAMGQVHLAEALIKAVDLAGRRDGERRAAFLPEARASLDAAEPILRGARARAYLERLDAARERLATR